MAKTKKPKHIAVAGNIGAGKTTLTEMLSKHYRWIPQFEDVDHNPYLNDFYEDMRTRHQASANSREGQEGVAGPGDHTDAQATSGNGSVNGEEVAAGTKDGTRFQQEKSVNLTPNG